MFNTLLRLAGLLITLALPAAAVAAPAAAVTPPVVVAARVTTTPERGRLILDLSAPTQFAILSLGEPDRVAVDVKADSLKFDTPPPPAGSGLITGYTVELAAPGRARATMTLAGPVQVQQAYVLDAFADQPARLVIDVVPDTAEHFAARVAADAAGQGGANGAPAPASAAAASTAAAAAPAANAAAVTANSVVPAAAASAAPASQVAEATPAADGKPAPAASPTASRDVPKPLIVLDPGHGGLDSGAREGGVLEKDIVLAFALKLQKLLVASGRFDVALTRTDDEYLTLEQRVDLARQNKASLFISLHADSFTQPQIHGASLYTRDEQATDVLDKVLADNENKSDIVAGFGPPKMQPQVVDVLVELMRRQMRKESYLAAEAIVQQLEPAVELRRFPVRQADFFVLQAPDVPSMLIELGFMSNGDDIANLTDPKWQDKVAEDVARGIGAYFDAEAQRPAGQTAETQQPEQQPQVAAAATAGGQAP